MPGTAPSAAATSAKNARHGRMLNAGDRESHWPHGSKRESAPEPSEEITEKPISNTPIIMNKNEIDQLLSKFYRGETTLDEELLLRNSLSDDSVDALLMKELEDVDNEIEVPADLESSLSDLIDQWDDEEQQEAKIAPSMWRRTSWWAAAACVAIIATVGVWFMRNPKQPAQSGKQRPVIARVEEPTTPPVVEEVPPAETQLEQQPAVQPQPEIKQKVQQSKSARVLNNNVMHLAQAQAKPQVKTKAQAQPELSASDEEIALAALEKFATTLNKGMDQLNEAGEKIDNINNTIHKHLL